MVSRLRQSRLMAKFAIGNQFNISPQVKSHSLGQFGIQYRGYGHQAFQFKPRSLRPHSTDNYNGHLGNIGTVERRV